MQGSDRSLSDQGFYSLTDKTESRLISRRGKVCLLVAWYTDDLARYGRPGTLLRIAPISSSLCSWFHPWMGDTRGRVNTNECVEEQDLAALLLSSSCICVPIYSCSRGMDIEWKKRTEKRESEESRGIGTGICSRARCRTMSGLQETSIDWPVRCSLTCNPQSWRPVVFPHSISYRYRSGRSRRSSRKQGDVSLVLVWTVNNYHSVITLRWSWDVYEGV